jgi:hypothetical protein
MSDDDDAEKAFDEFDRSWDPHRARSSARPACRMTVRMARGRAQPIDESTG